MIERPDIISELPSPAQENLDLLRRYQDREDAKISGMQLLIERISAIFGSPAYFAFAVAFIVLWVAVNYWGLHQGWRHVDAPPFFWLQALVSSNALLLTVTVLIRQNRMGQIADHRMHLDLQINMLTEQKAAKILQIVDELQRELTAIRQPERGKHDSEVAEMTKPTDTHAIMHAIKKEQTEKT